MQNYKEKYLKYANSKGISLEQVFYKKYLLYKKKYIELQQKGGHFDYLKYESLAVNDIEMLNHLVTPMNAYNIVDSTNNDILTTTGVVDCVVVMIYNKNHGRYIGHFLKFNEFEDALSNACEINRNPECDMRNDGILYSNDLCSNIDFMSTDSGVQVKTFVKNSSKISQSLPKWITDKDTVVHIVNSSELFKVYSRYNQIFEKYKDSFKGKIKLYLKKLLNDDKALLRSQKVENIAQMEAALNSQSNLYYQIFGIKPNGNIFGMGKDDLQTEKYRNFYKSIIINRLAAPNINKKCIVPYFLNMELFYKNEEELKCIGLKDNSKKTPLYSDFSNSFFDFIEKTKN